MTLKSRVIPCLDVKDGLWSSKGFNFVDPMTPEIGRGLPGAL